MKNKVGFTLAEILITIGIIGVIAAMTIPALTTSIQKKMTVAKLQKHSPNFLMPQNLL